MVKSKKGIAYKSTEMIQLRGNILRRDVLTEVEQKAVMYVASQVKEDSKEGDWYHFEYKNFAKITGIEINGRLYTEMMDLVFGLEKKQVIFREEQQKGVFSATMVVSPRFYDSGIIEYQVSPNLLPHFKAFASGFTLIDLTDYMAIRGKYPLSLYELMLSWSTKGFVGYEIKELREKLAVPDDAYPRAIDFVKKIRLAVIEINKKSQKIKIKTEEITGARNKIEAIKFKITKLDKVTQKSFEEELEEHGQTSIMDVIEQQTATSETVDICPECGEGHIVERPNTQDGSVFWGCDRFPKCKYKQNQPPRSEAAAVAKQEKPKIQKQPNPDCPKCHGQGYYEVIEDGEVTPRIQFCGCKNK